MLLVRTSRKVLFTKPGLLLVDQARNVLRAVTVLNEIAIQRGHTEPGPRQICLSPTRGPKSLPPLIPTLHPTSPPP